jgi:hypothetical protein
MHGSLKFRKNNVTDLPASNSSVPEQRPLYETVDAVTRARAGSLAAHGAAEQQIADILMLSLAQVVSVKETEEFKKKYSEVADEVIQRQIDAAEGWDFVEEKALKVIIETLDFNRDPKYALFAAKTANAAVRRKPQQQAKVIDASQQGGNVTNNIIVLNVNRGYVNKVTAPESTPMIDVSPKVVPNQKRISDLPSPKIVDELLGPVREKGMKLKTELEQMMEISGVVFDSEDGS